MRIAIASSGLGHVARGIETWALDTASALAARRVDVTLFAAGEVGGRGAEVSLTTGGRQSFGAAAATDCRPPVTVVVLSSLRRGDARAQRLAAASPGFLWHWQLKSPYGWEQLSFWLKLWTCLRRGRFDILHVQDPMLAYWCRKFRILGLVGAREILAHGTEESPAFLRQFRWVQHLAPWHLEREGKGQGSGGRGQGSEVRGQRAEDAGRLWVAIPNFVDTWSFTPEGPDLREELGISAGAFVVGSVAAVKRHHKRVDYLIGEFASFARRRPEIEAHLVVAGARTSETDGLQALGEQLLPGRIHIACDLPRENMPALYRTLDVFALASLFEMMPIAVLEALASGRPVIANHHPVLQWMIGEPGADAGGMTIDMAAPGALAGALAGCDAAWVGARGTAARRQAERAFSRSVVIGEYMRYYERVSVA